MTELAENRRLRALLQSVLDTGVEHFHANVNADDVRSLAKWLGLTDEEYAAWVEGGIDRLLNT